jgi:hypothetical protein
MPRHPSLLKQLADVNKRLGQIYEAMPRVEDCGVASPEHIERLSLIGQLTPLQDRRTAILRRLRYTGQRRLENSCSATAMIFAGLGTRMLPFIGELALEKPDVAIELSRASGARLAKLVRLHLAPLAEQVAPDAPAPWIVHWRLREITFGVEAVSMPAPVWKPQPIVREHLPELHDQSCQPIAIKELKRGARRGRSVA